MAPDRSQIRVLPADDPTELPDVGVRLINGPPYIVPGFQLICPTPFAESDLVDGDFVVPPGTLSGDNWGVIDGWLLVQARQGSGWTNVTGEWLGLGIAREGEVRDVAGSSGKTGEYGYEDIINPDLSTGDPDAQPWPRVGQRGPGQPAHASRRGPAASRSPARTRSTSRAITTPTPVVSETRMRRRPSSPTPSRCCPTPGTTGTASTIPPTWVRRRTGRSPRPGTGWRSRPARTRAGPTPPGRPPRTTGWTAAPTTSCATWSAGAARLFTTRGRW